MTYYYAFISIIGYPRSSINSDVRIFVTLDNMYMYICIYSYVYRFSKIVIITEWTFNIEISTKNHIHIYTYLCTKTRYLVYIKIGKVSRWTILYLMLIWKNSPFSLTLYKQLLSRYFIMNLFEKFLFNNW